MMAARHCGRLLSREVSGSAGVRCTDQSEFLSDDRSVNQVHNHGFYSYVEPR